MQSHIKVIIKEPGRASYYDTIPNELRILQQCVDGNIETVTISSDTVIICDDEGRIKGKQPNVRIANVDFCGTIIVAGKAGDELIDIPRALQNDMRVMVNGFLFDRKYCLRCGKWYNGDPALSREDNKTEICPDCGQAEAMAEYARHKREAKAYD